MRQLPAPSRSELGSYQDHDYTYNGKEGTKTDYYAVPGFLGKRSQRHGERQGLRGIELFSPFGGSSWRRFLEAA